MKNRILVATLLLALVGLTACKDNCTCTPADCKFHTNTLDLTVMQPDWNFDDETLQYYFHFDVPEITWDIYDYGNWTICREFNYGTANAYQVALPMSVYMSEQVIDTVANDTSMVYYTQHIDYRLGCGYVEIQLTNSDYLYSAENPEDMHFRLQLIY